MWIYQRNIEYLLISKDSFFKWRSYDSDCPKLINQAFVNLLLLNKEKLHLILWINQKT